MKLMKRENQVISLEHAKKLKELGVEQDGLYWWVNEEDNEKTFVLSEQTKFVSGGFPDFSEEEYEFNYSAFTLAELGGMYLKS